MCNQMVTHQASLDSVFFALADPTRRRIVEQLSRKRLTVNEIAAGFHMSRPAVSKHLKVLEGCGILSREIVGREHHCTIDPRAIRTASAWFQRHERHWNSVLTNLATYLEKTK
ncbi:MAG: metalloregulator ArsR/SmtB family transcription factor [Vulcanimicrobiaceae bacterium]